MQMLLCRRNKEYEATQSWSVVVHHCRHHYSYRPIHRFTSLPFQPQNCSPSQILPFINTWHHFGL